MLTVFRSKAGAEVLMLGSHALEVLAALGREPADQGIFRGEQIEAALTHLAHHMAALGQPADTEDNDPEPTVPDLAARVWPLRRLLEAAQAQSHDVTWTVA